MADATVDGQWLMPFGASAIRSASSRCPPMRTTACRPRAPSRTSRSAACAMQADLITATILVKKAAAEANATLGRLDADVARAIVTAADEILERPASRSVRRRRLSGRRRHLAQHERERGARQPRRGNAGRAARHLRARAPERSRRTWASRRTTSSRQRRGWRCCWALLRSWPRRRAGRQPRRESGRVRRRPEDRPHASAGCRPDHARARSSAATPNACAAAPDDVAEASEQLQELNIGATAVGTGLERRRRLPPAGRRANLARYTGLPLIPASNLFRVTQSMGDVLAYSSAMRRLAVEVGKVASDLRLLSMGPRAGISEITLPAVQPGSSIMPGKVNPSVPEMVNQVCFQVMGCDTTVAIACEAGQLELNVMMPVIAWNALHASTILREAMKVLRLRCVDGIVADEDARARAARSQHGARNRAEPVHRLRGDRGDREGIGQDREADSRAGSGARAPRREAPRRDPLGGRR